ncbi:MAG TPA: V-type ATP synthase subunit F [Gemmatimonadales bacterium]
MARALEVLCGPETAAGFGLAGVRSVETGSPADAAALLRDLIRRPGTGVVLLEQDAYDRLPEDLRRELGRRPVPLVVPFPGPVWEERPAEAEAYIVELLRQVIGYRVRLR